MVDEIALRRFDKSPDPADSRPSDALEAAARRIAEQPANHIIVLIARRVEDRHKGSMAFSFCQAGDCSHLEQVGLLSQIAHEFMADD